MESLKRFSIPIQGLKEGMHLFDFQIDSVFFSHFEESPIKEGNFEVKLSFDKRPDMLVLEFDIAGTVKTECDRCLAQINLPVKDQQQLIVKYSLEEKEEAEVVYILQGESELNVAKFVYEYICLSMPMIKVYDCENEDPSVCNDEVFDYLGSEDNSEPETNKASNPIWDQLKNIKDN